MTADASIVVVTHCGVGDLVRSCLASIAAAADHADSTQPATRSTIIVVDNSADPVALAADYGPGVDEVIRVDNRGFGAAANAGIRLARTMSNVPVVVLNDDIEVTSGWLEALLATLGRDARVGAVQPALLRHGTELINSLGVDLDRFAAGSDSGLDLAASTLDTVFGATQAIDIFTGGAVLLRPEFLDATGGFDERYFLYYEDVDLALRGAELGWAYRCATSSVVYHRGGATTAGLGDELVRHQERNRLLTATRFAAPSIVARAYWLSIRRLRHVPRAAHARALAGGLWEAPGAIGRRLAARGRRRGAIVSPDGP